jgi:prepilin-type N-terminal cleavage/methylation domain-containing protein
VQRKAFTLIELLIVVAIIAILAAIAVPNFLEAQMRAKVSRAKADIRTVATAIESYAVDNNKYPIDGSTTDDQAYWYVPGGPTVTGGVAGITSPIAYLSSNVLVDPFRTKAAAAAAMAADAPDSSHFTVDDYRRFRYTNWKYTYVDWRTPPGLPAYAAEYEQIYGAYRLSSSGPDQSAGPSAGKPANASVATQYQVYDPTNGTVSAGDIMRSAKYTEQPLVGAI